jgi:hypothetical protein
MSGREVSEVDGVANRIFGLDSDHANWYSATDGSAITIVDTGLPDHW